MKVFKLVLVLAFVALSSRAAFAQDAVKVAPEHYKLVTENASVRVLRIDYAPGSKSPMHQHPDAIVIPLGPSKVRFTTPDGKTEDSDMNSHASISATMTRSLS